MKAPFVRYLNAFAKIGVKAFAYFFVVLFLVSCSSKKTSTPDAVDTMSAVDATTTGNTADTGDQDDASINEPDADADADTDTDTDFDSTARAFINNGFYLQLENEYSADGSLLLSNRYEVDYEAMTITSTDVVGGDDVRNALYTFDLTGDLQTITYFAEELLGNVDDSALLEVSISRNNGVLNQVSLDYLFGAESDRTYQMFYDDEGRISQIVDTNLSTRESYNADYIYNDDNLLVSIEAEDEELTEGKVVRNFTWDVERRLNTEQFNASDTVLMMTYDYNADGNVASITTTGFGGQVQSVYEYTYATATQPVFNLIMNRLYLP